MHREKFKVSLVSECSALISFDQSVSEAHVGELAHHIREQLASAVMNVVPSYRTILIEYLPFIVDDDHLVDGLNEIITHYEPETQSAAESKTISIPVYYSEETALDLARYTQSGLSLQDVIKLHTQASYTVSAIGFAPGFAFLSDVCEALIMPRHSTPRTSVPSGSVGIADSKTAVYPSDSPGGWNIIGRSPVSLFSDTAPFIPFKVGDSVTFTAITKQEFIDLGGVL